MLGYTGVHYRLRKAILAASILLMALIALEFVSAATVKPGGVGGDFIQLDGIISAPSPYNEGPCDEQINWTLETADAFNLSSGSDFAKSGFTAGNYDFFINAYMDAYAWTFGKNQLDSLEAFVENGGQVKKFSPIASPTGLRKEFRFKTSLGASNTIVKVVAKGSSLRCKEFARLIFSGSVKKGTSSLQPPEAPKPVLTKIDLAVSDRYKREHSLAPNGMDYEKQGLNYLTGKCTDCKDLVGIVGVYDEIESKAVVQFTGDINEAKNYEVFFTLGGSGLPGAFLKDSIRLSRCKLDNGNYICSAVFNSKGDELKRGGFIWSRVQIKKVGTPEDISDKTSQRLAVAAYNFGFFPMKYFVNLPDLSNYISSTARFNDHFSNQIKQMVAISDFNKNIALILKPIVSEKICDVTEKLSDVISSYPDLATNPQLAKSYLACEGILSKCTKYLRQCADQQLRLVYENGDRIIGITDWDNGTYSLAEKVVQAGYIPFDDYLLAHEVGHSFGLGEEYTERFGSDYPIWRNEYPFCCIDSRAQTCESKGGTCVDVSVSTQPPSADYAKLFQGAGLFQSTNFDLCKNNSPTRPLRFESCYIPYNNFENLGNHCWPTNSSFMKDLIQKAKNATSSVSRISESAFYGVNISGMCAGTPLTIDGQLTTDRNTVYRSVMGNINWRKRGGKVLYPPGTPCPLGNCPL
ncbi:MAG: hypothetical protein A3J53_03020 [Candidatus Harrisonbacteria bacterium RIFCSPHIGHO2_02_FULL_40_20]|nr:MAG: hypothetical protein A3J53_03020 [Candidatus Harrisonbacteria bacterium RIFCSPHIGHO2_02_FULL_40_20]